MFLRSCALCWGFAAVALGLLVSGESDRTVGLIVRVPALACVLMALALGIMLPLVCARDEYYDLPWDVSRKHRSIGIAIGGWLVNAIGGAAALGVVEWLVGR